MSSIDHAISVLLFKTAEDTNEALQSHLDSIPFDLEYGHPLKTQDDGKSSQPEVDPIQIAFGSQIFLIHLAAFRMSRSHTT